MRVIIVSGDRHAKREDWGRVVHTSVSHCYEARHGLIVIHGAAPGIDTIVDDLFRNQPGYSVIPMPAPWKRLGKQAGMMRNNKMLQVLHAMRDIGYETSVLGFHDNIHLSDGTRGMLNISVNGKHDTWVHDLSGKPVRVTEKIEGATQFRGIR